MTKTKAKYLLWITKGLIGLYGGMELMRYNNNWQRKVLEKCVHVRGRERKGKGRGGLQRLRPTQTSFEVLSFGVEERERCREIEMTCVVIISQGQHQRRITINLVNY